VRVALLFVLAGLMHAARSFTEGGAAPTHGAALAFGYVLLSAHLAGDVFQGLRLPRLTGYLAVGIATGPHGLALLTEPMVDSLSLVNGVAISLIALTAGLEMELRQTKSVARAVVWISLLAVMGTSILLAATCFLLRGELDFLGAMPAGQVAAVAAVLGVVMVAQSPAVAVALRDETASDGPVTRTVLAVVVIADLLVIVLFAVTSSLAKAALGGQGEVGRIAVTLAWQLAGSLLVGAVLGGLLATYVRRVKSGTPLFVLAIAFVSAEVGSRVDFDPLLVALSAGIVVRNATSAQQELGRALDTLTLPVYAVFFAVAGANMNLGVLADLALPLGVLFLVRATGLVGGTRLAGRLAAAAPEVGRFAGWGLIPQAGLALALAVLFAEIFPEFGREAASLTVGLVAANEIVGPVLFRAALASSGEMGRRPSGGDAVPNAVELSESQSIASETISIRPERPDRLP
jgi:Kef-type K+ transport system membrane component KefB